MSRKKIKKEKFAFIKIPPIRFDKANRNCAVIPHDAILSIDLNCKIPDKSLINVTDARFISARTGLPVKTYPLITMEEFLNQRDAFLVRRKYGDLCKKGNGSCISKRFLFV